MILMAFTVMVACFATLVFHYWNQVLGEDSTLGVVPFSRWLWAGLILPEAAWLLLNLGVLPGLPPMIPEIAIAKLNGRSWIPLTARLTAPGLLVIATYWAAVSFGHLVTVIAFHADSRSEFALSAVVVSLLALPLIWLFTWGGGLPWAGAGALFCLVPVTHCTLSLACRPKVGPMYARAIARMKLGKYKEAENEVIEQLQKREHDFEGWVMLAELYAAQFGDLGEAERTISWLCDQPTVNPLQISMAFHRLADWHLKFCDNPIAAKRALEEICRHLPGTHFAKMARLRQQQLPGSRQEWIEQKVPKKIALPALSGDLDAANSAAGPKLSRSDALRLANECVDRLKSNPNDVPTREKLARVFAEELEQADLGIDQLRLLLEMGSQPENKQAEWLSQLAAWQMRYRRDSAAARDTLERLVRELPQTAQAFAAQRWLSLLAMEQRTQKNSPAAQGSL